MWWLSFRDGSPVIIEATTLLHARMLAAVHKIGRVAQFVHGYELSHELAALIPDDYIGHLLSRADAWRLYDQLERSVGSTYEKAAPGLERAPNGLDVTVDLIERLLRKYQQARCARPDA